MVASPIASFSQLSSDTQSSSSGASSFHPLVVAPHGTDSIPTNFTLTYSWDYSAQRSDLRNLYEKSKDSMWNARTDLPWDTNVDPEAPTAPDEMLPIFGDNDAVLSVFATAAFCSG